MAVDFDHDDRAGLIKVIEQAKTGSPSVLADKIIASDWLTNQKEDYYLNMARDEYEHNHG